MKFRLKILAILISIIALSAGMASAQTSGRLALDKIQFNDTLFCGNSASVIVSADNGSTGKALTGVHGGWAWYSGNNLSNPYIELFKGRWSKIAYDSMNRVLVTNTVINLGSQGRVEQQVSRPDASQTNVLVMTDTTLTITHTGTFPFAGFQYDKDYADNYTSLSVPAKGSLSGQVVGKLLIDKFISPTSSANYTKALPTATATFNAGNVSLSGGNGTYGNYIVYNYNNTGSFLENSKSSVKFVSTVSGSGLGIVFKNNGNESIGAFIDLSAGASRGQIKIIEPLAPLTVATSTNNLTFSNSSDTILLEVRMIDRWTFFATASNISTPTNLPVTVTFAAAPNGTFFPRVYQPAVYTLGGTQVISQISLSTPVQQNPDLVIMGNSIEEGVYTTLVSNRWVNQVMNSFTGRSMNWSSGGNKIADLTSNYSELNVVTNKQRYYAAVVIGINDIINGRTDAQILSDYQALVLTIYTNGGIPILCKIPHVSSTYGGGGAPYNVHVDTLNARISRMGQYVVDLSTPLGNPNTYTFDGIHPTDAGHAIMANTFITSTFNFLRYGAWTYQYDAANGNLTHRANVNAGIADGTYNDNTGSGSAATKTVSAGASCYGNFQAAANGNKVNVFANGSGGLNLIDYANTGGINFFTGSSGGTLAATFNASQTLVFPNTTAKNALTVGTLGIQGFGANLNGFIADNAYWNGSNFVSLQTGLGVLQQFNNGKLIFYTAPSVSAGAAQTFTSRINFSANGLRVGDGTVSDASAVFHVVSTTQGSVAMPVMTTTQMNAIASPVEGLWIYNITTHHPNYYNGTAWTQL